MTLLSNPSKTDKNYDNDIEDEYFDAQQKVVETNYAHEPPKPGPGTPCPSYNEYVTPTFARNHHGVWRYVVQIPYEGYFTQTVQVTRCR